ncbi:hypothetical protein [Halosimplex amylolyticum]|uniref:hypothetical protein n=1 Tax=Halosimplex amylolyticum TaxID=3396616 RepID=UPI003F5478A8
MNDENPNVMMVSREAIRDDRDVITTAVFLGAVAGVFFSVLAVVGVVVLAAHVSLEISPNAFLFGGLVAGLVAGYVAGGRLDRGMRVGGYAGVVSVCVLAACYVVYNFGTALVGGGTLFLYWVPFFGGFYLVVYSTVFAIGGLVGGALGAAVR